MKVFRLHSYKKTEQARFITAFQGLCRAFLICLSVIAFNLYGVNAYATGTGTSGNPFTTLADAYTVSSGRYHFNTGSGLFQADVDNSEGGGWVLVLQYVHQGGTNPALSVLGAGADLPVLSAAALGTDESADATRWGHAGNAAMSQFTGDVELRWYGETSNHGRIIHFRSTVGDDYVRTGTGDFNGIQSGFTTLTGHTADLPGSIDGFQSNKNDNAFTDLPYYETAQHDWAIKRSEDKWRVDDISSTFNDDTIHRVWVRQAKPLEVTNTNNSGEGSLRQALTVANGNTALDDITFAIPGAATDVHTINLTSFMPEIEDDGITIDGTTQGNATCGSLGEGVPHDLRIEVGHSGIDLYIFYLGFGTDNVTLKGMALGDAGDHGLYAEAAEGLRLECLHFGVRADGTTAWPLATSSISAAAEIYEPTNLVVDNILVSGNNDDAGDIGMAIYDFGSGDATITGSVFGLTADGTTALPNGDGLNVVGLSNLTLGGSTPAERNIISGNAGLGVSLEDMSAATIEGNYIGTDVSGLLDRGNGAGGMKVDNGTNITIGGISTGARNIFSGNDGGAGLNIADSSAVTVLGNYIGLGSDGTTEQGNEQQAIYAENVTNLSVGDGTTDGRNIVAGNLGRQISVLGTSSNITIDGNYIGTDMTGNTALSNGAGNALWGDAIYIAGNVTTLGIFENVFGGFDQEVIDFWGSFTADDVVIQGNSIGRGADGSTVLQAGGRSDYGQISFGNGYSATNVKIGGIVAGEGNVLTNSVGSGIIVYAPLPAGSVSGEIVGNTITGNGSDGVSIGVASEFAIYSNSIHDNGGLGIDLGVDGVNTNDVNDGDNGPNDLLNFPLINTITADGTTSIDYDFDLDVPTEATHGYRIEFFKDNTSGDTNGEGQTYLGFVDTGAYTSGTDLNFSGTLTTSETVSVSDIISATTTRKTASGYDITSEFAVNKTATAPVSPLVVTSTADTNTLGTLRFAINNANANDTITFNIPGTGPHAITFLSTPPPISDPGVTIDGTSQSGTACGDLWGGIAPTPQIQLIGDIGANFSPIRIFGSDVTVRGLSLTNGRTGVYVDTVASNAVIHCNLIGLAPDGSTSGNTQGVELHGANAFIGGDLAGEGNVISGNVNGIVTISGSSGTKVRGNFIGTDALGVSAIANTGAGVTHVNGTSTWADISNNLISGNGTSGGIYLSSNDTITGASGDVVIAGNFIGLDRTGQTALANTGGGIKFEASSISGVTIGGSTPADRNIISGNTGNGITLGTISDVEILGNYIGTDVTGLLGRGNRADGMEVTNGTNITIGGITADERNIFSGNTGSGLALNNGSDITVLGNYIGVGSNGTTGIRNSTSGALYADNVTNLTIGGTALGAGNVISRNRVDGIILKNNTTATLLGNFIGTDPTGTIVQGNGDEGIVMQGGAIAIIGDGTTAGQNVISGNTGANIYGVNVGSTMTVNGNLIGIGTGGEALGGQDGVHFAFGASGIVMNNTIAYNTGEGVYGSTTDVEFAAYANSIFSNGRLGLELGNRDGVTVNDAGGGDADSGANDLLNFPVLNTITADGSTTVRYDFDLDTETNADGYRIDFFANSSADASGHGEGETYLGFVETGNHAGGVIKYNGTFTALQSVSEGTIVSATTTRKTGASTYDVTSEFSENQITDSPNDFSDAPLTGTSFGSASHFIVNGSLMGATIDGEPSAYDSVDASADTDDGVSLLTFTQGAASNISVAVSQTGGTHYLQAWADWNDDKDWNDLGEQIAINVEDGGVGDTDGAADGVISLAITVPGSAVSGPVFMRFRWSSTNDLSATATANDGEVEDYQVNIGGGAMLSGTRSVEVYDPNTLGLYNTPGNDVIVSVTVTNVGEGTADTDSIEIIDEVSDELRFYAGTTSEFGGQIIGFEDSGSGLTFDESADVGYSNAGTRPAAFADCAYTTSPGYDANVTYVCIRPRGAMAANDPDPSFTVKYRAQIE